MKLATVVVVVVVVVVDDDDDDDVAVQPLFAAICGAVVGLDGC